MYNVINHIRVVEEHRDALLGSAKRGVRQSRQRRAVRRLEVDARARLEQLLEARHVPVM